MHLCSSGRHGYGSCSTTLLWLNVLRKGSAASIWLVLSKRSCVIFAGARTKRFL